MIIKLKYQIPLYVLLPVVFQAMLGLSAIYHYCYDCGNEEKEVTLLTISHHHDNVNFLCTCLSETNICTEICGCENQHSNSHKHFCYIDFKKLDINSTCQHYKEQLPVPVEIDIFAEKYSELNYIFAHNNTKKKIKKYLFPPPLSDIALNLINCIFRL